MAQLPSRVDRYHLAAHKSHERYDFKTQTLGRTFQVVA